MALEVTEPRQPLLLEPDLEEGSDEIRVRRDLGDVIRGEVAVGADEKAEALLAADHRRDHRRPVVGEQRILAPAPHDDRLPLLGGAREERALAQPGDRAAYVLERRLRAARDDGHRLTRGQEP